MDADPYTALAVGYDFVMRHVDYDAWATYVHELLSRHGTEVERVIELGGGTGALAVRLQPLGAYTYVVTDGSAAMLRQARRKIETTQRPIRCAQADFTTATLDDLRCDAPADAVVLVYDGLNYLLSEARVAALFRTVHRLLRPGGVAVIDHSTPLNSEDQDDSFADEGATDAFSYVRKSRYDASSRRHETTFEMTVRGRHVRECHVQRPYSLGTMQRILRSSPLDVAAAYDGRTLSPAHEESRRVHWVLRRSADGST